LGGTRRELKHLLVLIFPTRPVTKNRLFGLVPYCGQRAVSIKKNLS